MSLVATMSWAAIAVLALHVSTITTELRDLHSKVAACNVGAAPAPEPNPNAVLNGCLEFCDAMFRLTSIGNNGQISQHSAAQVCMRDCVLRSSAASEIVARAHAECAKHGIGGERPPYCLPR